MVVWLIAIRIVAVGAGIVVTTGMFESRIDRKIADTADDLETKATMPSICKIPAL